MDFLLATTLSYLLLYNYVALFVVAFLAAFLFPLPSSAALLASGAFASQGFLNIYAVLIVALAGNILGDLTGYFLAQQYGKEFLMKIGFRKIIESKSFIGVEKILHDNSGSTIFITRFVGEIGPLVNILSGLTKMPFRKFFLYEATGELVYALVLGLLGYYVGSTWQNLTGTIELVGVGLIVILTAIIFTKRYFRKSF